MTLQLLDLFARCGALEFYLRNAEIERVRPLEGGGGHPDKMTLVLQGGVGVAAKAGGTSEQLKRAKREVAAWRLAFELGIDHLVPATVLRDVPSSVGAEAMVPGSVQVLWPRFKTAVDAGVAPSACPEDMSWPVALLDTLAANTDRNLGNWGVIDELPHVALIDHGHAFDGAASNSEFAMRHQGQPLPADLLGQVQHFVAEQSESRLGSYLDRSELEGVFIRAATIATEGTLSV